MKKRIWIIISAVVLVSIFVLVATYFDRTKEISTRPEFKTVVMYDAFEEFISKSKDSKNDTDILYKEIILDSVYEKFLDCGEDEKLAAQYIGRTMRQLDDLTYILALLKEKNVEMIVNNALLKSNSHLTGINTTVYIFPSVGDYEQLTDQGGGVSGVTIGSGKIMILVDPTVDNWESMLSYVVAHEYHHSIWTSRNLTGFGITLLDHLVVEGRADSFANIVYPEFDVPWTSSIDLKTEQNIWKLIDDQLGKVNREVINKVMFGDGMDYPHWSGYTIGYHIVQNYLEKNSDVDVATWTNLSSSEILENSGYVKSQN